MTNFILSLAAIVTVTVRFLLLVKRHDSHLTEYEINTRFDVDTPANHPEMEAEAVAALVNQSFSGRGRPVSGIVEIYENDGGIPNAYAAWLEKHGRDNGNNVTVVRVGGRR